MYHKSKIIYSKAAMNMIDVGSLEYLWHSGGGSKNLHDTFVKELNRILNRITYNIATIDNGDKLTPENIQLMYHTPIMKYSKVTMSDVDYGSLHNLWHHGMGSRSLASTFVEELNRILVQIANNVSKIDAGERLTADEIKLMFANPDKINYRLLMTPSVLRPEQPGHSTGTLTEFVEELNRRLVQIANNVSKLA